MKNSLLEVKIWYNKITTRKVSYERSGIRPAEDWRIMLTATFWVVFALSIFSTYFYFKVVSREFFVVQKDEAKKGVEINMKLLKKTITDITIRENMANALNSSTKPGDPSM